MDEPPTKRARIEDEDMEGEDEVVELTEPRFYHFKILYDPSWDYKAICKRFFMEDKPYLCVLEHVNQPNTHVHFQGTSRLAPPTVKARLTRLAANHHLRKINPKARPTSMSARPVDVVGFQYMAKELKPNYLLAVNLFTPEELEELKEKSVLHCKKMKTELRDFIARKMDFDWTKLSEVPTEQVIQHVTYCLFVAQRKKDIELPEYNKHHTRTSIIRGLLANTRCPDKLKAKLYCL